MFKHRAEEPEPEPAPRERQAGFPQHWRASTPDEREAAFREYLDRSADYVAKVRESGSEPWHGDDVEKRRDLFMRRYSRPAPPAGMPSVRSLREFNQEGRP